MSRYKQPVYAGVPDKHPNRTRFNYSREWKSEFNPGQLVPCFLEWCMPGDEHELSSEYMFRFDSLYYPMMVLMSMRADTYWCPFRILWPEGQDTNVGWKRWITEQEAIPLPTMNPEMEYDPATYNNQVLAHMGIPLIEQGATKTTVISNLLAFPLAAILAIWDEYERNPLLEAERGFPLISGDNTALFNTAYGVSDGKWNVLPSKWMMDYLTSAIPTPQLGDPIRIPVIAEGEMAGNFILDTGGTPTNGDIQIVTGDTLDSLGNPIHLPLNETAGTVKELRLAEVLQAFYERIAKIGTRYRDWIKSWFGDDPEPGVVDVPVLIRSTFGRVQITDVLTTADVESAQGNVDVLTGNYRGNANLYEPGKETIRYNCKEHGVIIQLLQVNPNTSYGSRIDRRWRMSVQTDFPLEIFMGIGDQEILKEEVFYNSITAQLAKNQDTFGYIPRGQEWRSPLNMHHTILEIGVGKAKHLGRIWDIDDLTYDDLEIDADFVNASSNVYSAGNGGQRLTDVFRALPIIPDSTIPTRGVITAHVFHSHYVNRMLPLYSTPGKGI